MDYKIDYELREFRYGHLIYDLDTFEINFYKSLALIDIEEDIKNLKHIALIDIEEDIKNLKHSVTITDETIIMTIYIRPEVSINYITTTICTHLCTE